MKEAIFVKDENQILLEFIREQIRQRRYSASFSHTEKIRLMKIGIDEIEETVLRGIIIEPYPDDPQGASGLIMGYSGKGRPLHVLCGNLMTDDELLIITEYEPDVGEWEEDLKTRKLGT